MDAGFGSGFAGRTSGFGIVIMAVVIGMLTGDGGSGSGSSRGEAPGSSWMWLDFSASPLFAAVLSLYLSNPSIFLQNLYQTYGPLSWMMEK